MKREAKKIGKKKKKMADKQQKNKKILKTYMYRKIKLKM